MSFALHPAQLWAKWSVAGAHVQGAACEWLMNSNPIIKQEKKQHRQKERWADVSCWAESAEEGWNYHGVFSWIILLKDYVVCIGSYWIKSSSSHPCHALDSVSSDSTTFGANSSSSSQEGSECQWRICLSLKTFGIFYKLLELTMPLLQSADGVWWSPDCISS